VLDGYWYTCMLPIQRWSRHGGLVARSSSAWITVGAAIAVAGAVVVLVSPTQTMRIVAAAFDLVTVVGATPSESGDPHGLIAAAVGLARPGGQVMIAGLEELVPLGALDRWFDELPIDDVIVDEDRRFPSLPFHLVVARVTPATSSRVI